MCVPLEPKHHPGVVKVAEALPAWFTARGIEELRKDLATQQGLVALDGNCVVGFLTFHRTHHVAPIGWMGVQPDRHRRGVGRRIIEVACALSKSDARPFGKGRTVWAIAITERIADSPHPPDCPQNSVPTEARGALLGWRGDRRNTAAR